MTFLPLTQTPKSCLLFPEECDPIRPDVTLYHLTVQDQLSSLINSVGTVYEAVEKVGPGEGYQLEVFQRENGFKPVFYLYGAREKEKTIEMPQENTPCQYCSEKQPQIVSSSLGLISVVSPSHQPNWFDLTREEKEQMLQVVEKVVDTCQEGFRMQIKCGKAGRQLLPHACLQLITTAHNRAESPVHPNRR